MSERFPGGYLTNNPPAPTAVAAPGVWTMDQALQNIKAGTWPDSGALYVENVFSPYVYTGNASAQAISAGVPLQSTGTWSAVLLQNSGTAIENIYVDSSQNVYAVGYGSGGSEGMLVKYSSTGAIAWQRRVFETSQGALTSIAVDGSGNIFVSGRSRDSSPALYALLAKFDASGTLQWQRRIYDEPLSDAIGYGVTVDAGGDIYFCGYAVDATRRYGFLAKYNTSGTLQWQRKIYQNTSVLFKVVVDASNNPCVVGYANDGTRQYGLITKYNSSGTLQWQRKLYDTSSSVAYGVAVDSASNIYVAGAANDGTRLYALVAKYNSSGTLQWQRKLYSGTTVGYNLALDGAGSVYLVGDAQSGVAPFSLIAKYNSLGTLQWQRGLIGGRSGAPASAAYVPAGSNVVYVAGGGSDFAATSIAFTAALSQDGSSVSGAAGSVSMQVSTVTDAAGTATDAAGTATDAAGTATASTATAAVAAGAATATYGAQAGVASAGGMVWFKTRNQGTVGWDHVLMDTARGVQKGLNSNLTNAETTYPSDTVTAFTASGFALGADATSQLFNGYNRPYVSWIFRKASKFFDVVTYTGDGSSNRQIAHSLGSAPGCIIVKCTSTTTGWSVYHRSVGNTKFLFLNTSDVATTSSIWWNNTTPTATEFTVGASGAVNASGETYVAYLFAHDTASDGLIQCGGGTYDSSGWANANLGWEPQWVLIKSTTYADNWYLEDISRGASAESASNTNTAQNLFPNLTNAETATSYGVVPSATGFKYLNGSSGQGYIYVAIRRGPMQRPTTGTSVFTPVYRQGNSAPTTVTGVGFPPDLLFNRILNGGFNWVWVDRLRSAPLLSSDNTAAEVSVSSAYQSDWLSTTMDGFRVQNDSSVNASPFYYSYFTLRRAPGFFDVVCYTGANSALQVNHNLGVTPELMIVKKRSGTESWFVYSNSFGAISYNRLLFFTDQAVAINTTVWNDANPDSSIFQVAGPATYTGTYVAYLFATCPGVSKVGSYTGTGAAQTINCGFTGGARFILIKRTDSTGDWFVWDSARGITSGNDPYMALNTTSAQVTSTDYVNTASTGFEITASAPAAINASGGSYIFLAIA